MTTTPADASGATQPDRIVETNVSVLRFDRDTVRKTKKPVRFPFVDFTSVESRLAACLEEVRLNRRLAPDVYLGVEDIRDATGRLIDAAVVMRRLPDRRQLRVLIETGVDVRDELTGVAHALAAFHSTAARSDAIDQAATPDGLRQRWDADLDELEPLVKRVLGISDLERERALARRYIDARGDLLADRIRGGHAIDGHGDLRADSVFCLADGPRIIDCLEFDPSLRWGDELADVAFLAMDLESLGRQGLAEHFVGAYYRMAGWRAPPGLVHCYVAQRAAVRSKVACWSVLQGKTEGASRARIHLDQCGDHLAAARPLIVMIGGAPRTGKSTLARALAERIAAIPLHSDEIRRDVAGASHEARSEHDTIDSGRYAASMTAATYATLGSRAGSLLRGGYSVIVDATFPDATSRAQIRTLAGELAVDLVQIECTAPPSVIAERAARRTSPDDLSEATEDIAAALRSRRKPWVGAHRLDTTTAMTRQVDECLAAIDRTPIGTGAS